MILGEELGRVAAPGVSMAITVQTDMATPSLHRYGSEELKRRYLEPAIRGEMVAAIAVSEPDAGSDVAGLKTRAERDGDEWVINGAKLYITNGTQADWLLPPLPGPPTKAATGACRRSSFPTDTPGFSVSRKLDKLGMRPRTRPSSPSTTRGCRSPTRSARSAAASSSRWNSSRPSA